MKNQLVDLNNHLFVQLERLSDEHIEDKKLQTEIVRADAMSKVANQIIQNARLVLDAQRALTDGLINRAIPMLDDKSGV